MTTPEINEFSQATGGGGLETSKSIILEIHIPAQLKFLVTNVKTMWHPPHAPTGQVFTLPLETFQTTTLLRFAVCAIGAGRIISTPVENLALERKEKVSLVREKRCEGDHTVAPFLLHLAPPVTQEELVGGSLRGRLFYIFRDLEGTLHSPGGRKTRRYSAVARRVKIALSTPPHRNRTLRRYVRGSKGQCPLTGFDLPDQIAGLRGSALAGVFGGSALLSCSREQRGGKREREKVLMEKPQDPLRQRHGGVVFFVLFRPRDPEIHISAINLPQFSSVNGTARFYFAQYAAVRNPNRAAFSHYDSSLQVLYAGGQIGFMYIPAGEIAGGQTVYMSASFPIKSFPLVAASRGDSRGAIEDEDEGQG
ncbi:hypothetical protein KFK09_003747 [Dendrobium nobile]|uniref:Uncharacterized protein n=1 Tax=Dendrobium nobile TaxID=94219 RepID=A0A8T3C250_DENNO|nr:hypothetical protein KFK09_003747 [Dendrobium nobile]